MNDQKQLQGYRILVVEDDEMLRETLVSFIQDCGADAVGAENGTVGLEKVLSSKFDAVITDIRMPGGNGLTLVKNMHEKMTDRPLIFVCSGFSDIGEFDFSRHSVSGFFDKPFALYDMLSKLTTKLGEMGKTP
ncbi:MAG: response regulator [Proteobacteria bacterium]|nr:MAG: response regulator [Pseudomonadota bacterium]